MEINGAPFKITTNDGTTEERIVPLDTDRLTLNELYAQLKAELPALDDGYEYFSLSPEYLARSTRPDEPIGRYRWLACYAVTGGSEGHYVHVDRLYAETQYARSFSREALFLYKTFGGWDNACRIAAYLGARLGA